MRKHLLGRAAEEVEPLEVDAQALWREAFGPRTAAWLIRAHRRQLHRSGAVDFVLKASIWDRFSKPQGRLYWLSLAFETLKRRPGWSVVQSSHRGSLRWRVRWHAWLERAKRRPIKKPELTVKDIQNAVATLEANNIPPMICEGCGKAFYVINPDRSDPPTRCEDCG